MIEAREGWAVLEYDRGEDHNVTTSGLIVPTARNQRVMMKGKMHNLSSDPDHALPDIIRVGTVVSSKKISTGVQVFFNKHDGFGFTLGDRFLYLIKEDFIAAAISPDGVGDNADVA